MATKATNEEVKETKKTVDPFEEPVPFYAFKDNNKYQDDITVCINGKTWRIQRGKQVMIPRKVALVLAQSQEQDGHTADYIANQAELVSKANF